MAFCLVASLFIVVNNVSVKMHWVNLVCPGVRFLEAATLSMCKRGRWCRCSPVWFPALPSFPIALPW